MYIWLWPKPFNYEQKIISSSFLVQDYAMDQALLCWNFTSFSQEKPKPLDVSRTAFYKQTNKESGHVSASSFLKEVPASQRFALSNASTATSRHSRPAFPVGNVRWSIWSHGWEKHHTHTLTHTYSNTYLSEEGNFGLERPLNLW